MKSASGMKTVILNWKDGENDPFSVMNDAIRQHFRACGKNVEVLEISELNWPDRLVELASGGIDFAFTWQGLGSTVTTDDRNESVWNLLRIPLICVHGDHPAHMPLNHQFESRYCFHLYANAEFARYSNRHFRKSRSARAIDMPQLHCEPRLTWRPDAEFVVIKNIVEPIETEKSWRQHFDKVLFDTHMMAAEILTSRITRESYVDVHEVLDGLIDECRLEWLRPQVNLPLYHQYHSQLDFYVRNHKSVIALAALREFPVRVYGRGWKRIAQDAPAIHRFEQGLNMADSQALYYTRFGLVDVSPSKGLHDRTQRAMVNGCSFLSSASLEDSFSNIEQFDSLFYSFRPLDLPEKCAAVMRDPEGHRDLAQRFAHAYHEKFHFKDFVSKLDLLADVAKAT